MMVGRFFVEKRVQYAAESSFSKGGEVMCRVIASLWLSKVESLEGSVIHDRWGIAPDIRRVETSGPVELHGRPSPKMKWIGIL
jgi:hypothetical protein